MSQWFRMLLFQKSPGRALTLKNTSLSFSELRDQVDHEKNLIKNTLPASMNADTSFEFIIKFLASIESKKPIALFNSGWTESERLTRASLLAEPTSTATAAPLPEIQHEMQPEISQDIQRQTPKHIHPECALILFTSGSSGQPKAVQLSRQNINANTQAVIKSLNFAQAPAQTLFLPLHYSFGILGQLLPALQLGIETRLYNSFNEAVADIPRLGLTGMWSGVPSHWQTLLKFLEMQKNSKELTESTTHIVSAGAPLSLKLRQELMQRFSNATVYNNYGLTECSPRVLSYNSKHPLFLQNYVGFPVGDLQVRISPEGELLLKGSQVMLGYLEESKDNTPSTNRIQNGWFSTGDLAEILEVESMNDSKNENSDKNQNKTLLPLVKILGRADDLVKIAGERFSKIEIEQIIKTQDCIEDAVVLTKEHSIYGQVLIAALVLKENHSFNQSELMMNLAKKISSQKIPKEYQVLSSLPRLTNGKLDRSRLLEILNIK